MADHAPLQAAIFDVDGVLVDSPHEQAWRETLDELMGGPWEQLARDTNYTTGALTTMHYQHAVAGRPRLDGARRGLQAVGVIDPDHELVHAYAAAKQHRLNHLLELAPPPVFGDAVALLLGLYDAGLAIATASSSLHAGRLVMAISLPDGRSLSEVLKADVSGFEAPGKPNPAIFLEAARRLALHPRECLVIEDAPAGVGAAHRGGMACVAVDRNGAPGELRANGADLVLERLDRMPAIELLARLSKRSCAATPVEPLDEP
jgi:beta-phosphoglucomutase